MKHLLPLLLGFTLMLAFAGMLRVARSELDNSASTRVELIDISCVNLLEVLKLYEKPRTQQEIAIKLKLQAWFNREGCVAPIRPVGKVAK